MKKNLFKKAIALGMSVIMFSLASFTVLAEGNKEYISELCVASNSDANAAKKELTDKGYTVIDNNVNDGTGKEATYIGYKTTTNGADAITDMRVMDMKGGYSYSEYETALKKYEETVTKELNSFSDSIKEFRELYEDGDEKAVYAYNQLNKLKEDDSGKLIGDIFVEKETDMATLTKVFVQGSGDAIKFIENVFAIVYSDEWLEDAAVNTAKDYGDATYLDEACATMLDSWDTLQNGLYKYYSQLSDDDGFDMANYSDDNFKAWQEQYKVTEEQASTVFLFGCFYQLLSDYETANGKSLVELFLKSKEELTYKDLYPLAEALSDGALQAMKYVGLVYTVSLNDCDIEKLQSTTEENKGSIEQRAVDYVNSQAGNDDEKITVENLNTVQSVYAGVDRSLFDKNGGIALTSDAQRAKASTKDTVGACLNNNSSSRTLLAFGVGISFLAVFAIVVTSITTLYDYFQPFGLSPHNIAVFKGCLKYGSIALAIGAGLIVASVLIGVKDYYNPKYTPVPRVIVDKVTVENKDESGKVTSTESKFIAYYAAFDAEDTGSGNRKYGDLNGWGAHQWNALYTTKDKRAGKPITTDFLVRNNSDTPESYSPLRYFGSNNSAFNLNSHAFTAKSDIYLFYRAETTATTVGSSFTAGYIAIAGMVGLVIGGFGTLLIVKNKKEKRQRNEN